MHRYLNRFLSLLAILLLGIIMLTSCNADNSGNTSGNAEISSDDAKQQAEENLAAANKALAEAKTALEKALEAKAENAELANKIAELNEKLKEAQQAAAAADSDIAAALADLGISIDAIINDSQYMRGDQQYKMAESRVAQQILLSIRMEELQKYKELYKTTQWEAIEKQYQISMNAIANAADQTHLQKADAEFEAVLADNKNEADRLYDEFVKVSEEKKLADVKAFQKKTFDYYSSTTSLGKELLTNYFGKANLMEGAIRLYISLAEKDMAKISDTYLVNSQNTLYGLADKKAAETAQAEYTALSEAVRVYNEAPLNDVQINADIASAFESKLAWYAILETADERAAEIAELNPDFNADLQKIVLNKEVVESLLTWGKEIEKWSYEYILPLPLGADEETAARRDANIAILTAKAQYEADIAILSPLAEAYKTEGYSLQIAVSQFYAVPASEGDLSKENLAKLNATVDKTKVTLDRESEAAALQELANAFTQKYGSDDLSLLYEIGEKTLAASLSDIEEICAAIEELKAAP